MKIFKNNKLYIQLKDIWFIKDYVSIPQRIWKKVFEDNILITNENMDYAVIFEDIEDILFFENQSSIVDLDILNSKTIEQLDNIIEDINQEILDISNKYKYDCNDFNSQFEGTRMRAYNNHKNCKKQIDLLEYKKESIENYKLNFRKNKQKVK